MLFAESDMNVPGVIAAIASGLFGLATLYLNSNVSRLKEKVLECETAHQACQETNKRFDEEAKARDRKDRAELEAKIEQQNRIIAEIRSQSKKE